MLKIIALILYVYSGEITLEQKVTRSQAECEAHLNVRMKELVLDPEFDLGVGGYCLQVKVTEASNAH